MKKHFTLLSLMFSVFIFSCGNSGLAQSDDRNILPEAFKEKIDQLEDEIILDVRTPQEVEQGKIQGSINIDFYSPSFELEVEKLNRSKPIMVYCASGRRSEKTMNMLLDKGYARVYNLDGGFQAWQENSSLPKKP